MDQDRSAENRRRPTESRRRRRLGGSPCADASRDARKAVGPREVVHSRQAGACASPPRSRPPAPSSHCPREPAGPPGRWLRWSARRRRPPPRRRRPRAPRPSAPRAARRIEPDRLAARRRESSPAWSSTGPRTSSRRTTCTGHPSRRRVRPAARAIRSIGSWPRARTTARRDGTGTSSVGPGREDRRRGCRERPTEGSGQREHAVLLVCEHHRAEEVVVLPRREARGQAVRARRRAHRPTSARGAARHRRGTATVRGLRSPHSRRRGRGRATRRARHHTEGPGRRPEGSIDDPVDRWGAERGWGRQLVSARRSPRRSWSRCAASCRCCSACRGAGPE